MKNLKIPNLMLILLIVIGSIQVQAQNPANPENPYDYIGKIHNEILHEFRTKHKKPNMSIEETYAVFNDLVSQNLTARKYNIIIDNSKADKSIQLLKNGETHFKNNFKDLTGTLDVSTLAKEEISKVFTFIFKTALDKNMNFQDFHHYSINEEKRILSSRLSDYEKNMLLGSYSTARYSYEFWTRSENNRKGRGFWGTLAVIGGDVAGFIFSEFDLSAAGQASDIIGDAVDKK